MMVMLLQRLTAPQSTYSLDNKTNYLCDYFEKQDNNNTNNNINNTTSYNPNNNNNNNNNNNQQLLLKQICCDNEFKSIDIIKPINNNTYYCNNISKNNNNNINNNNNNININILCDKDKLRTNVCYHNKTVITNNNNKNNSSNNNNNGYNDEDTEDDQQLLARDKLQNKRHQETIITNSITTGSTTTPGTTTTGTSAAASLGAAAGGTTSTLSASQARFCPPGQGVAMRYYRLWIYASNIVLLGSAIGLAAAVARTLLFTSDPRRYLIPGVPRALDPTALYAYLALATQLGLVQLLGCIAARRLSARLLHAYWLLLLVLLAGDTIIGVAWIFRFERIRAELRPSLRLRLQLEYGRDLRFSDQWDQLQREFSCCGIVGPSDFDGQFNYPDTCCPVVEHLVKDSITTATIFDRNVGQGNNILYNINDTNINIVGIGANDDTDSGNLVDEGGGGCQQPFANGCEEYLMDWLGKTADLLFVLGYCVMAFAKVCFIGILRYEIREMIQKIRLLREPPPPATSQYIQSLCQPVHAPAPIPAASTAVTTMTALTAATTTNTTTTMMMMTGSDQRGSCGAGDSAAAIPSVTGNNNIPQLPSAQHLMNYHHQDHATSNKHSFLYTSNLQQQQDTGADSDTNSHCALILEESSTPTPPVTQRNCHHPLISGLRDKNKNNGNNNYEMREFNRRYLISNGDASSPQITAGSQPGIKIITQNKRT